LKSRQVEGLSFAEISRLTLGSDKKDLFRVFGKPDEVSTEEMNSNIERWVYNVKNINMPRAVFLVDKTTNQLRGKSFYFLDETENALRSVLSGYKNANFEIKRRKQTGHYIPNEILYSDEKMGLYFVVSDARQEVQQFSWIDPKLHDYIAAFRVE
jgi:hypothetical protein